MTVIEEKNDYSLLNNFFINKWLINKVSVMS